MIRTIPLNKLIASPRNVRQRRDPDADAQLKADIETRGLLQNLVVSAVKKPRGCFAVEAGERRRRALRELADEGKLSASEAISCLVVGVDDAGEASLAENFQRLAMNPADECVAFRQLMDQGFDSESIARRFGLTVRFVEGRLRLANLAPVVFDALGAGTITLDVAKAYAATPDCERQAHVFEQVAQSYASSHPDSIRRMMTQATISASDRRALFLGEEAYLAAGGRVERDLFSDDKDARWLDVALIETLASEKLAAAAAEIASEQGLAFVTPLADGWISYSATEGLRRIAIDPAPLTDDEATEVNLLEEQIGALIDTLEDEDLSDDSRRSTEAKIRELDQAIDIITNKPPVIDDSLRASIGTFLLLDDEGRPKLSNSFYVATEADRPEVAEPSPTAGGDGPRPERKAGLPRRLVDELAMQRRDILAVHVASDARFATDLATFLMIDRDRNYSGGKCGSSLIASPAGDPVHGFETPAAAATVARSAFDASLDRSWTDRDDRAGRFEAFRQLSDAARAAWLGWAVARTLEASVALPGERACVFHDRLGELLAIDVAQWWRPTGANYFDRAPKSFALAALTEVGGPSLAGLYGKAKKPELAQACERIFAGDAIVDADVRTAALAWVPDAMRFGSKSEATDEETEPELETPTPVDENAGSDSMEEAA